MQKLKTGHYLIIAFVVLIALLIGSNYVNKSNDKHLNQNGIETLAIITDIDVNNYKANEMEGKFVENYVLTFNFTAEGKELTSIRTIEKKVYGNYFDRTLKVSDTIAILYDASNPKNNKIKELNP